MNIHPAHLRSLKHQQRCVNASRLRRARTFCNGIGVCDRDEDEAFREFSVIAAEYEFRDERRNAVMITFPFLRWYSVSSTTVKELHAIASVWAGVVPPVLNGGAEAILRERLARLREATSGDERDAVDLVAAFYGVFWK